MEDARSRLYDLEIQSISGNDRLDETKMDISFGARSLLRHAALSPDQGHRTQSL